jgi:hypothetical protein
MGVTMVEVPADSVDLEEDLDADDCLAGPTAAMEAWLNSQAPCPRERRGYECEDASGSDIGDEWTPN